MFDWEIVWFFKAIGFPGGFSDGNRPEERLKCIAYNLMHYSGLDILAERDTDAGKEMDRVILSRYCKKIGKERRRMTLWNLFAGVLIIGTALVIVLGHDYKHRSILPPISEEKGSSEAQQANPAAPPIVELQNIESASDAQPTEIAAIPAQEPDAPKAAVPSRRGQNRSLPTKGDMSNARITNMSGITSARPYRVYLVLQALTKFAGTLPSGAHMTLRRPTYGDPGSNIQKNIAIKYEE